MGDALYTITGDAFRVAYSCRSALPRLPLQQDVETVPASRRSNGSRFLALVEDRFTPGVDAIRQTVQP